MEEEKINTIAQMINELNIKYNDCSYMGALPPHPRVVKLAWGYAQAELLGGLPRSDRKQNCWV